MQRDCLACGARGSFWTRKAGRDVWRCPSCKLVWVPEGLVVDEGGASIYEGDTPIFLQDGNEQYYLDETNLTSCRLKVDWIEEVGLPRGAKVLDVGANFGHFLSVARERWNAVGVELSRAAVEWSKKHFGVNNHAASIYDLPPDLQGPYEAVTLFDVIEHVPQPKEALAALRKVLEPGGHLFLSTPDMGSGVARSMGARWHYLDPVQHIVLFNRKNLARLLEEAGFEVVSARSFGHHYRMGYVLDRLAYLHDTGVVGAATKVAKVALRPAAKLTVYVNLRDVMGIHARAR